MAKHDRLKMRPDYQRTIREMEPGREYRFRMDGRNAESFRVAIFRETVKGTGQWAQTNDYSGRTVIVERVK